MVQFECRTLILEKESGLVVTKVQYTVRYALVAGSCCNFSINPPTPIIQKLDKLVKMAPQDFELLLLDLLFKFDLFLGL